MKSERTENKRERPDPAQQPASPMMAVAEWVSAVCDGDSSPQANAARLTELRRCMPAVGPQADAFMLDRIAVMHKCLTETRETQCELQEKVRRLAAPPHFPATYLGPVELNISSAENAKPIPGAIVQHGSSRRHLPLDQTMDGESLGVGEEVLLNSDLSAVIAKSPAAPSRHGDMGVVDRILSDNRLVIRAGADERIIGLAAATRHEPWRQGDPVLWDRSTGLALERLQNEEGREFIPESVPNLAPSEVGGLGPILQELITVLTLVLSSPAVARRYGLVGQRTILLDGPPGVGKTLLAKVAAAEVQRLLGRKCSILIVKPGQFEDPYVGVTQQRIRECFRALRQADGFGLLFLDEVESIGRARGVAGSVSFHNDKFLAALLAEIQGFETDQSDGEAPRALIAATNRTDMLDPALVERMQVHLHVPRPNLRAAREIFEIHLSKNYPYSPNGDQAARTREDLIERALSLLFGPNAANGLSTIRFRDNTRRIITARELLSGRAIWQMVRSAKQAAAYREVSGGEVGLRMSDIQEAVAQTIEKLAASLTRGSVHQYLGDLRQDVDVVAVEPIVRRVTRPHQFLTTATN